MKNNRPIREDIFIRMAQLISYRSTCDRRNVGTVVINSITNKILSVGYNGTPKGYKHCDEIGHLMVNDSCVRTDHAESNALICISNKYSELSLYTTDMPCLKCLSLCIHFSVKNIFFINWYNDNVRDQIHFHENVGPRLFQYIPANKIGKFLYKETIYLPILEDSHDQSSRILPGEIRYAAIKKEYSK